MFEGIIFFLIILYTILSSGYFLINFIIKKKIDQFYIYEIGFLGIFFYTFLSFLIHLFFPLSTKINFIVFVILIIFSLNKNFIQYLKTQLTIYYRFLLISFIVTIVMTIKYNVNEDYGYYHLPYIINMISDKVIFGLSNLHTNFAWNSSWLNFSSMLNFPFFEIKGTQLSNSVFFFFLLSMFLIIVFNIKENSVKFSELFIFILSAYIIIKFARLKVHGFDFPANLFFLLTFYYFIRIFEESNIEKNYIFILFFSIMAVSIKLSTFIVPLFFLISFFYYYKNKNSIAIFYKPILFSSFFVFLWLLQQIIYSGCMIPFLEFTCFSNLEWHDQDISKMVSSLTGAVNKSFNQYQGNLTIEEYVKNFNWVGTWFERNKIEFSEHLSAFIVPFILILIINYKKNFKINKNKNNIFLNNLFLFSSILIIFLGTLVWFFKSPVIRFGIPYLFLSIFIILILIHSIFKIDYKKYHKGFKSIIIIALIINLGKNFARISKDDEIIFWPQLINISHDYTFNNKIKIYYPNSKDSYHKLKYCWNIPFICHTGRGKGLYFYKKNNYLFIKKIK